MADITAFHFVGAVAIATIVGLFASAALISFYREREFRKHVMQRPELTLERWIAEFHSVSSVDIDCVQSVLATLGSVYSIPATCFRPEDEINEDYGILNSLILDRPLARVCEMICEKSAKPDFRVRVPMVITVSELIQTICASTTARQSGESTGA